MHSFCTKTVGKKYLRWTYFDNSSFQLDVDDITLYVQTKAKIYHSQLGGREKITERRFVFAHNFTFYSCCQSFESVHEFLQLWDHCLQIAHKQGRDNGRHGQDWFWPPCQRNRGWFFGISPGRHQSTLDKVSNFLSWHRSQNQRSVHCEHASMLFAPQWQLHPYCPPIMKRWLSYLCHFSQQQEQWLSRFDNQTFCQLHRMCYQFCLQQMKQLWQKPSIKLKIDQTVGAGLLESEFDWCSHILTEDMSVVVSTNRLLKKVWQSTFMILICQYNFCECLFSKVDSIKGEVICPLSMKPLLKQARPVCF